MVKSGWAAPFLIFPSIPAYPDLVDFQEAAKTACESRIGAWAEDVSDAVAKLNLLPAGAND